MFSVLKNSLATIGGIVVVPVICLGVDCTVAYFTNTSDDLKIGVKTPITGLIFVLK